MMKTEGLSFKQKEILHGLLEKYKDRKVKYSSKGYGLVTEEKWAGALFDRCKVLLYFSGKDSIHIYLGFPADNPKAETGAPDAERLEKLKALCKKEGPEGIDLEYLPESRYLLLTSVVNYGESDKAREIITTLFEKADTLKRFAFTFETELFEVFL